MIENLAMHRIAGGYDSHTHVINWVKYKDHTTPSKHKHAINEVFRTFRINGVDKMDVDTYLILVEKHLRKLMKYQVNEMGSIKVQLILEVEFISHRDGDVIIKYPKSDPITVLQGSNIGKVINEVYNTLKKSFEKISNALDSSDYIFNRIISVDVDIHEIELIRGGSYIELPEWIKNKHAVLNPKNDDEECFKWAVIQQGLHHEDVLAN